MTDTSFNNWISMSDQALAAHIGSFVKHHRLEQNRTQDALSHDAGISRSTTACWKEAKLSRLQRSYKCYACWVN